MRYGRPSISRSTVSAPRGRFGVSAGMAMSIRLPSNVVSTPSGAEYQSTSSPSSGADFCEAANHAFRFALNTARQLNAKLYITHAVDITSIQGITMDQSEIERHAEQTREKIDKLYMSKLDGFANAEVIVR